VLPLGRTRPGSRRRSAGRCHDASSHQESATAESTGAQFVEEWYSYSSLLASLAVGGRPRLGEVADPETEGHASHF